MKDSRKFEILPSQPNFITIMKKPDFVRLFKTDVFLPAQPSMPTRAFPQAGPESLLRAERPREQERGPTCLRVAAPPKAGNELAGFLNSPIEDT